MSTTGSPSAAQTQAPISQIEQCQSTLAKATQPQRTFIVNTLKKIRANIPGPIRKAKHYIQDTVNNATQNSNVKLPTVSCPANGLAPGGAAESQKASTAEVPAGQAAH